jgi:hypothetical protein
LQAVLSTGEKFLVAAGSVELAELQVIASAFQARPPASSIAAVRQGQGKLAHRRFLVPSIPLSASCGGTRFNVI